MFEVSIKTHFSAAHRLEGYNGACAELHGHNWEVEVFVSGERLDAAGMLVDFRVLKDTVAEVIVGVDHKYLNDLPMFVDCNPSSEQIAKYLYDELSAKLGNWSCRVSKVSVQEAPGSIASYWE
ncbi:MAG: 6-carboxytetrahydropterin synthase QueD [Lentisphaerae bacterium]|nr:6-carboxytetrahydropterin synthase QueD [Lentisphaerota bacterium]